MQDDRTSRVALVTGAGGALGQAFCELLAGAGYQVIEADIRPIQPAENSPCDTSAGVRRHLQVLDVCREASWQHAVQTWQSVFPQLHLLVNAAGTLSAGHFGRVSVAEWSREIEVNLQGTILGCHVCAGWLQSGDLPSGIINISSCAAFLPLPWSAVYNATKAGILAFSESLAEEWRSTNCQITAACPGFFASKLFAVDAIEDPQLASTLKHLLGRVQQTAAAVAEDIWAGHRRGDRIVLTPPSLRWWYRWKRWFPRRTNQLIGRHAWARYERSSADGPG